MPAARVYDPNRHNEYLAPYHKRLAGGSKKKRVARYNPEKHNAYLAPYHKRVAHRASATRRTVYPNEVPSPFMHTANDAKYFTRFAGRIKPKRGAGERAYRAKAWPAFVGTKARMPGKRLLSFARDRKIAPKRYVVPKRWSAMDVRKYYDVYDKAPSTPRMGNFMSGGMYYRVKEQFMDAINKAADAVKWAETLQKKLARIQRQSHGVPAAKPAKATAKKHNKVIVAAMQLTNQTSRNGVVVPRASPTPVAVKAKAVKILRAAAKTNPAVVEVVNTVAKHAKKNGAAAMVAPMRRSSRLAGRR
jgi:hypothetical protein